MASTRAPCGHFLVCGLRDHGFAGCGPTERIAATVALAHERDAAGLESYWIRETPRSVGRVLHPPDRRRDG